MAKNIRGCRWPSCRTGQKFQNQCINFLTTELMKHFSAYTESSLDGTVYAAANKPELKWWGGGRKKNNKLLYRSFYESKDWIYLWKKSYEGREKCGESAGTSGGEYCASMPLESDKRCL